MTILVDERKSLLRGFLAIFVLALPFTFLPTLLKHGFSMHFIQQRLPESLLFAAMIAAAVVIIALLNNYEKLLLKKRLYNFPAFTALGFEGGVERYDSIVKELSTYLVGKIGNYFYRLDIIHPGLQNVRIGVAPMIRIDQEEGALMDRLVNELHFKERLYLSRILSLSEEQLQDEDALRNELLKLSDELTQLGVTPSEVAVEDLQSSP